MVSHDRPAHDVGLPPGREARETKQHHTGCDTMLAE
jgi:hypothetical protein